MSLHQFNPGKKSWKIYGNTLTSISGDNLNLLPYEHRNLILETSGNGKIQFKENGITYNLADLSNINLTGGLDSSFTNLDVSNNTTLNTLLAIDGSFTNLDVSNNTTLKTLLAVDASFANVDISKSLTLHNASLVFTTTNISNITIKAPLRTPSGDYSLTLPKTRGISGDFLSIDGFGELIFKSEELNSTNCNNTPICVNEATEATEKINTNQETSNSSFLISDSSFDQWIFYGSLDISLNPTYSSNYIIYYANLKYILSNIIQNTTNFQETTISIKVDKYIGNNQDLSENLFEDLSLGITGITTINNVNPYEIYHLDTADTTELITYKLSFKINGTNNSAYNTLNSSFGILDNSYNYVSYQEINFKKSIFEQEISSIIKFSLRIAPEANDSYIFIYINLTYSLFILNNKTISFKLIKYKGIESPETIFRKRIGTINIKDKFSILHIDTNTDNINNDTLYYLLYYEVDDGGSYSDIQISIENSNMFGYEIFKTDDLINDTLNQVDISNIYATSLQYEQISSTKITIESDTSYVILNYDLIYNVNFDYNSVISFRLQKKILNIDLPITLIEDISLGNISTSLGFYNNYNINYIDNSFSAGNDISYSLVFCVNSNFLSTISLGIISCNQNIYQLKYSNKRVLDFIKGRGNIKVTNDNNNYTVELKDDIHGGSIKEHVRIEVNDNGGGADILFYTRPSAGTPPTQKLRINNVGAIGIGGANYGNSGQVLTSSGSGSAVSWSDSPSFNQLSLGVAGTNQGILNLKDFTNIGTDTVAQIKGVVDESGPNGGELQFFTKKDGGSLTERLSIHQNGLVKITTDGVGLLIASQDGTTEQSYIFNSGSGTKDLVIDAADGSAEKCIAFKIGGSEKIQIGYGGQIGIGGKNYGSSGQVLTSNGSGDPVSWSNSPTFINLTTTNFTNNGNIRNLATGSLYRLDIAGYGRAGFNYNGVNHGTPGVNNCYLDGLYGFGWCRSGFACDYLGVNTSYFNTNRIFLDGVYGHVFYKGALVPSSDDRLKINEKSIPNALNTINNINFYEYDKVNTKDGDDIIFKERGVIAQEILNIEDISYAVMGTEETHYSVAYQNIFITACQAIKDLTAKVAASDARIAALEAQLG